MVRPAMIRRHSAAEVPTLNSIDMVRPARVRRHSDAALLPSKQPPRLPLSDMIIPRKKLPKVNAELVARPGPTLLGRRGSGVYFNDSEVLCGSMKRAKQAEAVMDLRKAQFSSEIREALANPAKLTTSSKNEAEDMLRWAMRDKEIGALQNCIQIAEAKLSDGNLISEAKVALDKLKAERTLWTAIRKGSMGKLEAALNRFIVLDVEQTTHHFKADFAEMGIKYDDEGSVQEVKAGGQADKKGIRAGDQILKVSDVVWNETGLEQLEAMLNKFQEGTSDYAITFQVQSDSVVQAKRKLSQMKAKQALSTAMSSKDARQLGKALEQSLVAGVENSVIAEAKQVLAKLRELDFDCEAKLRSYNKICDMSFPP